MKKHTTKKVANRAAAVKNLIETNYPDFTQMYAWVDNAFDSTMATFMTCTNGVQNTASGIKGVTSM